MGTWEWLSNGVLGSANRNRIDILNACLFSQSMITATDPNAVDYMELIGQNEHNNAQIQSIQHETSDEDVYDHGTCIRY